MSRSLRTVTLISRPFTHQPSITRSRIPVRCRHSLADLSGPIRIQEVRFIKPPIRNRIRKFALRAGTVAVLLGAITWYFDLLEDEEDEETAKQGKATVSIKIVRDSSTSEEQTEGEGDGEEDEDEVDVPEELPEDAIFIPLSFARRRPQEFYKGSDPEWQSFIEFRKDREREKAVRNELATLIQSNISSMKPIQRGLGTPVKIKQFWIDVIVPDGPPPEYERRGLEIGDDYIAITTRPVSHFQTSRFQSAALPLPAMKSLWASASTSFSLQFAKVKHYLNWDNDSDSPNNSMPSGVTSIDQLQETKPKQDPQPPARMDKMSDPKSNEDPTTKGPSKPPREDSFPDRSKILSSLPTIQSISGDDGAAMTAFKRTMSKTFRHPQNLGERGTLLVSGLVQLEGPKGICVIDAVAWYHPREARYTSVQAGVRSFRPRQQRPRGGP